MFDYSLEYGRTEGLGVVKGYVDRITSKSLPVPHTGWSPVFSKPGRRTLCLEAFQINHFSILIIRLVATPQMKVLSLERLITMAILLLPWLRGITMVFSVIQRNLVPLVWHY